MQCVLSRSQNLLGASAGTETCVKAHVAIDALLRKDDRVEELIVCARPRASQAHTQTVTPKDIETHSLLRDQLINKQ